MSYARRPRLVLLAVGALVLSLATALAAGPAQAVSGQLDYDCEYRVADALVGGGRVRAQFDTGITDGLVVHVGDKVAPVPITGQLTLPADLLDVLRATTSPVIRMDATLPLVTVETGETLEAGFEFDAFDSWIPLVTEGPMTVAIEGGAGAVEIKTPGTHSLSVPAFTMHITTSDLVIPEITVDVSCAFSGEGSDVVDAFKALPVAPTPPPPVLTRHSYTCTYQDVDQVVVGRGTILAWFDTSIPKGLVVPVGTRVPIDPFVGSLALPSGLLDLLRDRGDTTLFLFTEALIVVPETGDDHPVQFWFHPDRHVDLPPAGGLTVGVRGDGEEIDTSSAGTYSLSIPRLDLQLGLSVACELAAGDDGVFDAFRAETPAPAPAEPVRPVVVQTDFSDPPPMPRPAPLLGGPLLLALAGD